MNVFTLDVIFLPRARCSIWLLIYLFFREKSNKISTYATLMFSVFSNNLRKTASTLFLYKMPLSHPSLVNQSQSIERLEVVGQPCYTSRLRYRSDFNRCKARRAFLRSLNNSNYHCPTIRVCQLLFLCLALSPTERSFFNF